MNREEFLDLLDTYGSDLACWPVRSRLPAQALLQQDPEAAFQWRALHTAEAFLHEAPPPPLPRGALERLEKRLDAELTAPDAHHVAQQSAGDLPDRLARWRAILGDLLYRPMPTLGLSGAFGLLLGLVLKPERAVNPAEQAASMLLLMTFGN